LVFDFAWRADAPRSIQILQLKKRASDFSYCICLVSHHLIIPESDNNPQPQLRQHLLPPSIFFLLQIVDISIHLHNQRRLVTVKVNDKSRNDLLSSEMDSQLICSQFLPQNLLGRSHLAAEFFGALKFFFGDALTWDDVFYGHGVILMEKPLSRLPRGREAVCSSAKH